MRIFLSSLLALFLAGCASYPNKNGFQSVQTVSETKLNPYFANDSTDYVYKANIEAFGKTFGGLFIVKKLGTNHHRTVFTTEIGNTLFDFTFQEEDFKVNRIYKELDRKLLINILKRDFKTLLVESPQILKTFQHNDDIVFSAQIGSKKHYFYRDNAVLQKIVRTGGGKEKVAFLFSKIEKNYANNIQIVHKTIPLTISLSGI